MLSRRAKYALKAMIALTTHRGEKPLSVTVLAQRAKVPRAFLEQIVSDLKRRNLLVSLRGKQGGFRLARPPDQISFADVIRPIDGPLALAPCASRTAYRPCPECGGARPCVLSRTLVAVRDASADILENTSLADASKGKTSKRRRPKSYYTD
jgi:Rrf2 family protein